MTKKTLRLKSVPPTGREVICAAGGLLWRRTPRGRQLAVIRRERYGTEWCLPKGKLEPGEAWTHAAIREIQEETGCLGRLGNFAGSITYLTGNRPKVVLYWHLQLESQKPFRASEEVKELRWMGTTQALKVLAHARERRLVRQALATRPR